jgi:3-oxoacyl-[acyl-carrier-protein] synthase II
MDRPRAVVTGLGTLNAVAQDVPEFARALQDGRCGIGPVTVFDTTDFRTHTGGEVKHFNPTETIPPEFSLKRMSRSDRLAFAAVLEALTDAGLMPVPQALREKTAVVIGGGAGGMLECEAVYGDYLKNDGRSSRLSQFASFCCASSADHIAAKLGLMGPKTTFMTACSSGATAVGYARDLICRKMADVVVAGGTEPLCRITYAAFNALQAVDESFCKPFDKNRRGLSLGEGAGIVILESLEHARRRGAFIHGEVLGYGVSCDAHHMTAPDPEAGGAVRCMQAALRDAGVRAASIDYINAHGTATPANDVMETRGIKTVFGRRADTVPISSTKSMIGHTLGAAGAIETVACLLAITQDFIPPTIHLTEADPECDLDYVSEGSRPAEVNIVLSNSFAFGGNNTSVVLAKFSERGSAHA